MSLRSHLGKPITYKKRAIDELVRYDGNTIALLFQFGRKWSVVLHGDVAHGAPRGVSDFASKAAAVEYALKAHRYWKSDVKTGLFALTLSQQDRLHQSRGLAMAGRALAELGGDPEHVAHINKMSDDIADAIKEELDEHTTSVLSHRKGLDPADYLTDIKYLRSTQQ